MFQKIIFKACSYKSILTIECLLDHNIENIQSLFIWKYSHNRMFIGSQQWQYSKKTIFKPRSSYILGSQQYS